MTVITLFPGAGAAESLVAWTRALAEDDESLVFLAWESKAGSLTEDAIRAELGDVDLMFIGRSSSQELILLYLAVEDTIDPGLEGELVRIVRDAMNDDELPVLFMPVQQARTTGGG